MEKNESQTAVRVFVSYSHNDMEQKEQVMTCLHALPPGIAIEAWDDTRMLAGDEIDDTIFREIDGMAVFLALISRNYLASAYCRDEMKTALMQAEQRGCRVVPVIVRPTASWREYPIGQKLALPPDGRAPTDWDHEDQHWAAVEEGLLEILKALLKARWGPEVQPHFASHHQRTIPQVPIDTIDNRGNHAMHKAVPAGTMSTRFKRFDVALSFSGADRDFVRQVADQLIESMGREKVFYDENFEEELIRPNLDIYLTDIYAKHSNLCVVFLSSSYADREWCGVEWRVMRDILKKKKDDEIMFFRFDDTEIPGMLSIDGYGDASRREPADVAHLILQRLNLVREAGGEAGAVSKLQSSFGGKRTDVVPSQNPTQPQTPIDPPPHNEYHEIIRKALIDLFSNSRLSGAVQVLLGSEGEVDPRTAADELFQKEPLAAVTRWNEVAADLYAKLSATGEAQKDIWPLLESVHFRLLPRLVDLSRLTNHPNFPSDSLLFTVASPHDPPNRPIELLYARMNRNRVVQFEQRGHESSRDIAVPCTAVDVTDAALTARADPDVESAVEQIGFELIKRFHGAREVPEQMGPKHWKKLNASLKAGRHGVRGFYMVIPPGSWYSDPSVLKHLYINLPNLPRFLLADDVGEDLPFVCDPFDIDAAIEEFWHLKNLWCGDEDR